MIITEKNLKELEESTLKLIEENIINAVDNVVFDGYVDLSNNHLIYDYYTVDAALEIGVKNDPAPIAGGYAELTLVGDGSTTPTFASSFNKMPSSESYLNTLGTLNKVGVYYDGTSFFYTITVIS